MRGKRLLPKVLLIAGILALFLILKYQNALKETRLFNLEKARIHFDNFFYFAGSKPQRKRPVALEQKETELKLYVGEPFRDFSSEDWKSFWDLVYGARPKDDPEKPGLPRRVRQLTADEIAAELISLYPAPFVFFSEAHWESFFGIIFKKR